MDERFRESWFNREHVVLGRRLHPFCLYDALILSEFDSPFVSEPEDSRTVFSLEELQTAVLVCSLEPEIFLNARLIRSRWDVFKRWLFGVRTRRMCPDSSHLAFQGKLFGAYLQDFCSAPETWEREGGMIRIPWVLSNVVYLLRHTNMKREDLWRLPIGQVFWYAAAIANQIGETEVMSSEEEAAMKELGYGKQG